MGWGKVDDDESIGAVHRALELGVNFFDTADVYGAGHSERVLARALAGRRQQVVIATKFGNQFDENSKQVTGTSAAPDYIRQACEASLRRLGTEYIDLYQFHWGDYPAEQRVKCATRWKLWCKREKFAPMGGVRILPNAPPFLPKGKTAWRSSTR